MRSTSSPPSGVFISRCIIPTSWLVSPFTAASAAPWIPPPLPQQLHQPLGIAGSGQTVEGLLIFDQIGGQALLPLFAASFLIHTGSPFQEDFIPVYAPDEVR